MISSNTIIRLFLSTIMLIAILPKAAQMVVIGIFLLILIIVNKKIYLDKETLPFLAIGCLHLLSISINIFLGQEDSERIMAAINTGLLWIFSPMLYSFTKRANIKMDNMKKISKRNFAILAALALLYIVYIYLNLKTDNFIIRKIAVNDWIDGLGTKRFGGLMEYPNLVPLFLIITLPGLLLEKKYSILYLIATIAIIATTNSRSGIIVIILCSAHIIWKSYGGIIKNFAKIITPLLILLIPVIVVMVHPYIKNEINTITNMRQNSTSMRMDIYKTSINKAFRESPIIGVGIKEKYKGYPLGSHSTYIGSFYKTGIVGLILLLIGLLWLLKSSTKSAYPFCFAICITLFTMLLVEDIDGSNWLCVYIFMTLSVYNNEFKKEQLHDK